MCKFEEFTEFKQGSLLSTRVARLIDSIVLDTGTSLFLSRPSCHSSENTSANPHVSAGLLLLVMGAE